MKVLMDDPNINDGFCRAKEIKKLLKIKFPELKVKKLKIWRIISKLLGYKPKFKYWKRIVDKNMSRSNL